MSSRCGDVLRLTCSVAWVALAAACGTAAKPSRDPSHAATPPADAGAAAAADAAAEPVEPWPATKSGAAWLVLEWKMNDSEATEALRTAGFDPQPRSDGLDVVSRMSGWKASITFDAETKHLGTITVRGDPATVAQAHAERAKLEERFGAPVETHVHWSKQCANDKAIEIEGPIPAWRVTQSFTREGDATTAIPWPSLDHLTWGMPLAATKKTMRAAGFVPEKLPPPPKEKMQKKEKKPAKPKKTPPKKKGAEVVVELGFKKKDEHVKIAVSDKNGLSQVAIGQDVADRKTAERRAKDVMGTLGACLSEAETESSVFRDATADVRVTITGFQGQRIVVESYRSPGDVSPMR